MNSNIEFTRIEKLAQLEAIVKSGETNVRPAALALVKVMWLINTWWDDPARHDAADEILDAIGEGLAEGIRNEQNLRLDEQQPAP